MTRTAEITNDFVSDGAPEEGRAIVDGRGGRPAAAATNTDEVVRSADARRVIPRMQPPTHTDPDAIPRNGTDVPLIDLDDPSHDVTKTAHRGGGEAASAAGEQQRRR